MTGVRLVDILADELVILAMRADPKSMDAACHGEAEGAVVEADSDAVKSTMCNRLEMQRWMTLIGGLELREISMWPTHALNLNTGAVSDGSINGNLGRSWALVGGGGADAVGSYASLFEIAPNIHPAPALRCCPIRSGWSSGKRR